MNSLLSHHASTNNISRILFVDDDQNLLDAMRRGLARDYEIHTASGSDQALRMLAAHDHVDVIVSDLRMPGMDGIALLSRVRDLYPATVRIILTGHADLQNALDAVNECQAFRILSKPCPPESMKQALRDAVAQSRLIQSQWELAGLRRINEAMEGIIIGFTKMVEAKDPYTAGHQRKVAALAVAISQRMGFDDYHQKAIRLAALVHDIGKIYVPMEFLNKPGVLTDLEFSIIKQHPRIGSEILAPLDSVKPLSRIVLEHHERLNGSGYPNNLQADNICNEAKIIAVADTVDAIVSDRPYRRGRGLDTALLEIETGQGTLYDAHAVAACIHLFREEEFRFPLEEA